MEHNLHLLRCDLVDMQYWLIRNIQGERLHFYLDVINKVKESLFELERLKTEDESLSSG